MVFGSQFSEVALVPIGGDATIIREKRINRSGHNREEIGTVFGKGSSREIVGEGQ